VPRAKRTTYASNGPTAEDLADFESALAGLLQTVGLPELPEAVWAQLGKEAASRGYTLTLSPAMGGRAYRIAVPVGAKRAEIYLSATDDAEALIRGLILAVRKLPVRE
jgi:hypothetical protein